MTKRIAGKHHVYDIRDDHAPGEVSAWALFKEGAAPQGYTGYAWYKEFDDVTSAERFIFFEAEEG